MPQHESDNEDVFRGLGVEIRLPKPDDFLKVRETLTRIGIASKKTSTLFQSCHILHKQGRYAIMHFKEMFILDGLNDTIPEEDIKRRNTITKLLEEWNLVEVLDEIEGETDMGLIKVLPYREKGDWSLVPKYSIGNKNTRYKN